MFRRLLIANRGEIACRVIRTARGLGIHTIAVYSDADAGARHVRLADEAWRLGPAPARDSYLSVDRILEAARKSRADAIHPGYGFLSERAEFAAGCDRAGFVFVGPPAAAMAAMGSKNAAKEAMRSAGVPVLPGYHGEAQTLDRLEAEGLKIGFPLIVKPSGGGGGKGMHIVTGAAGLKQALAGARRLAESAFADPALLIERYLPAPRHIEVQVLCDSHGHSLHLHTRDCSVQRRHQKLIEEAPAPGIPAEVRTKLHAAGLTVARAVGYVNAGTVEFLYSDGEFWFMEMNTRLQVEHCVTEEILGLDLVEWQLRIAAGEALGFSQQTLVPHGHAIEGRVCAEDPANDFAPSAGTLVHARWPESVAGVRVDAGFEAGDRVASQYDSLLGKVVGRGADRAEAIAALARGLQSLRIVGVTTNAGWLAAALEVPEFARGEATTRFVAEHSERLAAPVAPTAEDLALGALAVVTIPDSAPPAQPSPWDARDAFRLNLPASQSWVLRAGASDHSVAIVREATGWRVRALGTEGHYEIATAGEGLDVIAGGARRHVDVFRAGDRLSLWRGARRVDLEVVDPRHVDARLSVHEGELVARLPGTVVAVPATVGATVEAGATLMVLEAMKMEHAVLAPRAGVVTRIHFAPGDRVPEGAVLVDLSEPIGVASAVRPGD
ncbi:MAG TPA: biotin carboxylase N-terminal domain-containing protein [Steroidobacteraceae bacterium]|nr:biotin carboxylase N-terminal domain-containing protein [Steroidobacteraceae bacterium]